jgi:predicted DNA-binding protein (UPF0251 family)
MTRPRCQRHVGQAPAAAYFKPRGIPLIDLEEVVLTLDELESIRLADLEKLYHEAAADRMKISRATFGRILESARGKVADALLNGHALRLKGGDVVMYETRTFVCNECGHRWSLPHGTGRPVECPDCRSANIQRAPEERGRHRHGGRLGCRHAVGRRRHQSSSAPAAKAPTHPTEGVPE